VDHPTSSKKDSMQGSHVGDAGTAMLHGYYGMAIIATPSSFHARAWLQRRAQADLEDARLLWAAQSQLADHQYTSLQHLANIGSLDRHRSACVKMQCTPKVELSRACNTWKHGQVWAHKS